LKKPFTKDYGVAQGEGPEFKAQYFGKKKIVLVSTSAFRNGGQMT
jgi:hypothetical protein